MNAFGFPQSAALNEPVNEVMRLASGYDAGQPVDDLASVFYILWGVAILGAALNLLFLWALRRQINNGGQFRLIKNLLLPLAINLGLIWFMFFGFPTSMDSDYKVMFVYVPDTSLIFLVSAGVILLTQLLRLWIYLRSRKAS